MANLAFRKLHRQLAPIIFLPLMVSAITGLAFSLATGWGKIGEDAVEFLMVLHQGEYLGKPLVPIYILLVGLGAIAMVVTGLTMTRLWGGSPTRPGTQLEFRRIHRFLSPLIFLPLGVSAITGVIYRVGRNWFGMSGDLGEIFLDIHQGEYLGEILHFIYLLLVGLGAIAMLITGINLTGIFRKSRPQTTDTDDRV